VLFYHSAITSLSLNKSGKNSHKIYINNPYYCLQTRVFFFLMLHHMNWNFDNLRNKEEKYSRFFHYLGDVCGTILLLFLHVVMCTYYNRLSDSFNDQILVVFIRIIHIHFIWEGNKAKMGNKIRPCGTLWGRKSILTCYYRQGNYVFP